MDGPLHNERPSDEPKHYVTKYRRRDLRADVLGARLDRPVQRKPMGPKYKVRMSNIPLEVSDYSLDDLVKEFGHTPVYSKVFDTKEGRTFILEFETVGLMNEFVAKFNDYEIKEGHKVTVDLYEQKSRMQKRKERRNQEGSGYGSHYREASPQSNTRPGKVNKRERKPRATLEELDAELEAYMTSGSQDSSISASIPPTTENTELTSPDITNSNSDAMQE